MVQSWEDAHGPGTQIFKGQGDEEKARLATEAKGSTVLRRKFQTMSKSRKVKSVKAWKSVC